MANLKKTLTNIFLKQADLPNSDENIKKMLFTWWKNPREKLDSGLTLTDEGFDFLSNTLCLKSYKVPFPKDFKWTTQVILFMDQEIDCPYYFTKKDIFVFSERRACELLLFSGDVRKYGLAKAMARKRQLNNE